MITYLKIYERHDTLPWSILFIMYISRMCKLFIKDQQPAKVPEYFKYSLRCAINTIFYLQWEREGSGGGGGKDKLKDRGIQTDGHIQTGGRTDRRTNEQTDTHTQIGI